MKKPSITFQLGEYIGEYIVTHYLPTLSTDMMKSNNVILVSEEETKKHDELNNEWFQKLYDKEERKKPENERAKEEWEKYRVFSIELDKKYLPEKIECLVPKFYTKDMNTLKNGIRLSLWDSDICSYKIDTNDDIIIDELDKDYDFGWARKITLIRSEK